MSPNKPRKITPRQEAESAETAAERLIQLATDLKLASLVAAHPNATAELLLELSHSDDKAVRKACTSNANTPVEALLKLGSQFPEQLLKNPVFDLLLLAHPGLFKELPTATLNSLLKRNQVPVELIRWAWKNCIDSCAGAILYNATTPSDIVQELAASQKQEIVIAAKTHINYSQPQLDTLLENISNDSDIVIDLLAGRERQDEFKEWVRSNHAIVQVSAMARIGYLRPESLIIAGQAAIAAGFDHLKPPYRLQLFNQVGSIWAEYFPGLFDAKVACLDEEERRTVLDGTAGCRRRNCKSKKPSKTDSTVIDKSSLPSNQTELISFVLKCKQDELVELGAERLSAASVAKLTRHVLSTPSIYINSHSLFRILLGSNLLSDSLRCELAQASLDNNPTLLASFLCGPDRSDDDQLQRMFLKVSTQWLARMAKSSRPGTQRLFAFFCDRCPAEYLARGVRSSDWLERFAIAGNPSTPELLLERMTQEGNQLVRKAAADNLSRRSSETIEPSSESRTP